ncbi:hypothetical protein BDY24DRAFT_189484 [Mrakia frigida]|uniref:uncharacterized protein n=1 Tax=Mrakia frigida TaxID=29902 RepID=UPI003FCBFE1B
MNGLFGSSSSTKILNVYLDEPTKVFTPGELLSGVATLLVDIDSQGKQTKLSELTSSLRCIMTTSYVQKADKARPGNTSEVTRMYTSDQTLWTATNQPNSSSPPGPELIKLPFSFPLPSAGLHLPPSFEGGTRKGSSIEGHTVARVTYFVKFVARKSSTFSQDERLTVPFIVMLPPSTDPRFVPPPIVPRSVPLPPSPPRQPTEEEGWITATAEKDFKEGWLSQPKKMIVKLSIPSVPALPRAKNIPFRLSLLLLAPKLYHVDPSSPEPPTISPPTPDSLAIFLIRNVFTQAQGKSQVLHQVVGPVTDLSTESRVWFGKPERKGAEFEDRYGCEVVCVGEMEVGWGSTQAAGPSFGVEKTRGLLSCGYHLRLSLKLKGKKNDWEIDQFLPIGVSSTFAEGSSRVESSGGGAEEEARVLLSSDLPPSYLEVEESSPIAEPKQSLTDAKYMI